MRPPIRSTRLHTQPQAASRLTFTLLACLAVLLQPLHSQSPNPQEKPMKHYALIFHTNSNRTLTPKEQHERQVEITAWAKQVTGMGVQLDPRALGETATNFSAEGDKIVSHDGSSDPTCTMAPLSRYASGPTPARPQPNPDRQPRSTEEEKHP